MEDEEKRECSARRGQRRAEVRRWIRMMRVGCGGVPPYSAVRRPLPFSRLCVCVRPVSVPSCASPSATAAAAASSACAAPAAVARSSARGATCASSAPSSAPSCDCDCECVHRVRRVVSGGRVASRASKGGRGGSREQCTQGRDEDRTKRHNDRRTRTQHTAACKRSKTGEQEKKDVIPAHKARQPRIPLRS